jgi:hypothetical protein
MVDISLIANLLVLSFLPSHAAITALHNIFEFIYNTHLPNLSITIPSPTLFANYSPHSTCSYPPFPPLSITYPPPERTPLTYSPLEAFLLGKCKTSFTFTDLDKEASPPLERLSPTPLWILHVSKF